VKAVWIARSVREQVGSHRALVAAAAATFCLLAVAAGGAKLGTKTAARWRAFAGQNVHVIAYLADDTDGERALGLAQILGRSATVAQATVLDPAEAFARLETSAVGAGVAPKTLENLEPTYFPRSIEIRLAPAPDLADRAALLAIRLREVPGIAQVDAMTSGLARLALWIDLGRRLGQGMLVALALVTLVALVAVFMRSRTTARQRSLVLAQLGDTATGIRLPTCLWMAAAALLGSGVGALLLRFAWRPLLSRLERSLGIVSTLAPPLLNPREVEIGLALVLLLGLFMGYFAAPLPRASDHA
jgi:cell division protein FtsX